MLLISSSRRLRSRLLLSLLRAVRSDPRHLLERLFVRRAGTGRVGCRVAVDLTRAVDEAHRPKEAVQRHGEPEGQRVEAIEVALGRSDLAVVPAGELDDAEDAPDQNADAGQCEDEEDGAPVVDARRRPELVALEGEGLRRIRVRRATQEAPPEDEEGAGEKAERGELDRETGEGDLRGVRLRLMDCASRPPNATALTFGPIR